jgi:hypothetical protein
MINKFIFLSLLNLVSKQIISYSELNFSGFHQCFATGGPRIPAGKRAACGMEAGNTRMQL